jgi:TetR/AcrR family transcriptional regulator, regulator of cefoperazone and chloramphenicol sensitivity
MKSAVKTHKRAKPERQKREPPGRAAIAIAARKLFVERGYAGTTIEAIAEEAAYAVPTVYFHFGTKAAIVGYLIDKMEAEDIVPVFQKSLQQANPLRMLEATAHIARISCERWWDVYVLVRSAGRTDPALSEASKKLDSGRLYGIRLFAEALERGGHLRSGLDASRATDIMWALASEDPYQRLVVERGWSHDEFETWLGKALKRELLRTR